MNLRAALGLPPKRLPIITPDRELFELLKLYRDLSPEDRADLRWYVERLREERPASGD